MKSSNTFIPILLLSTMLCAVSVLAQPSGQNGFVMRTFVSGDELGADAQAGAGPFDVDNDGCGEFVVFPQQASSAIAVYEAVACKL